LAKRYYECLVCGRRFPEGQGIVLYKAGTPLYFHSSRCAAKFLRLLLENLEDACAKPALQETVSALKAALEARRKRVEKRI